MCDRSCATVVRSPSLGTTPPCEQYPRLQAIYASYEQAGADLAEQGQIRRAVVEQANHKIMDVPRFKYLNRLKPFKHKMVEHALAEHKAA